MKPDALELKGLAVHDTTGSKIGEVVDFYFDAGTNAPEWLVVEGGLLEHTAALVPVTDISRDDQGLKTPYDKDTVMAAPRVDATSIDAATERALYEHYHIRRELPGRTTKKAAYEQDRSVTGDARLRSWKASNAA